MLFTNNEWMFLAIMLMLFVIVLSVFAYTYRCMKPTGQFTRHHGGFVEGFTCDNNAFSTFKENADYHKLITDLTDWGLNTNKLIYVNKIVPSFGFTKIREYVKTCVDNSPKKDVQAIMGDIAKEIDKQKQSEGFSATFEETEMLNKLKDIIGCQ